MNIENIVKKINERYDVALIPKFQNGEIRYEFNWEKKRVAIKKGVFVTGGDYISFSYDDKKAQCGVGVPCKTEKEIYGQCDRYLPKRKFFEIELFKEEK